MIFSFDNSYTSLPGFFYTAVRPQLSQNPCLIIYNDLLSESLNLNGNDLSLQEKAAVFSGNTLVEGGAYIAQSYAGHQFGHFTTLGDGRAILIGEHVTADNKRVDIQLKGSGKTPYSRGGDGRAPLGAMVREYLVSEAMHYLHIPTTRSLAIALTGDTIQRRQAQASAVLTRVASSHLRVGTFEFTATCPDSAALLALLDYAIERHYPSCFNSDNKALCFLKALIDKQTDLIIHWMRVGFIHGVMNTDNTAISGETIDYGPCAFMDQFDPQTCLSSIDSMGRYAYSNQPAIIHWNLIKLAECLIPMVSDDPEKAVATVQTLVNTVPEVLQEKWLAMMRLKCGFDGIHDDDSLIITELLQLMFDHKMDFTNTFNWLRGVVVPDEPHYHFEAFVQWQQRWRQRLMQTNQTPEQAFSRMKAVNPVIIARNHRVEQVIQAAQMNDVSPLNDLLVQLKNPYEEVETNIQYRSPPSDSEKITQTYCGT